MPYDHKIDVYFDFFAFVADFTTRLCVWGVFCVCLLMQAKLKIKT